MMVTSTSGTLEMVIGSNPMRWLSKMTFCQHIFKENQYLRLQQEHFSAPKDKLNPTKSNGIQFKWQHSSNQEFSTRLLLREPGGSWVPFGTRRQTRYCS